MTGTQSKTQRLFDLIAALLRHSRGGILASEISKEVPGYWGEDKNPASVAMMFERDKAELRSLGIEIGTLNDENDNPIRYWLNPESFFLRQLSHLEHSDGQAPANGARTNGVPFTSKELSAMARGADLLAQLGDSVLAEQAHLALRRLAHDLPVYEHLNHKGLVRGEEGIDTEVFEKLSDALERRKRVTFIYHALEQAVPAPRRALPYGLAHIEGRWSLFAQDEDANAMRQFRLRRLSDLKVSTKNPSTPDFSVPADFDLWALTRQRYEWELGSDEPETITVRFLAETGLTARARQYGDADLETPNVRSYAVRRREPFLRWVLSFAGEATVIAPQNAASAFADLARAVREAHRTEALV